MTCLSCENDQEFSMNAGNSETITFDATNSFGRIVNLEGCSAFFSFIPYASRFTGMAIRKDCLIKESIPNSKIYDQIIVDLEPKDTLKLAGKYVYQLVVRDPATGLAFVFQGSMIIHKNIDEGIFEEG